MSNQPGPQHGRVALGAKVAAGGPDCTHRASNKRTQAKIILQREVSLGFDSEIDRREVSRECQGKKADPQWEQSQPRREEVGGALGLLRQTSRGDRAQYDTE